MFHPTDQGHDDPVVKMDPTHKCSSHCCDNCSWLRAVQSTWAQRAALDCWEQMQAGILGAAGQANRVRHETFVGGQRYQAGPKLTVTQYVSIEKGMNPNLSKPAAEEYSLPRFWVWRWGGGVFSCQAS